jgi:uncharacterized protein (TIGR03435 family)
MLARHLAAAILCLASPLSAQLQFEVASVRPAAFPSDAYAAGFRAGASTSPCNGSMPEVSGTRVSITMAGICDLVRIAYDVKGYQVIGVPAALGFSGQDKIAPPTMMQSMEDARKQPNIFYDIAARAPGTNPPTADQVNEMLRALLAERFHLKTHRDRQELSFYALVPAKNGPKLTPAVDGCKAQMNPEVMSACGQTMEQLARRLNANADKTVIDLTGISGKFDYQIPIERTQLRDFGAVAAAIEQGLKLKLESRKGPVEVLIVDHVERPSEN